MHYCGWGYVVFLSEGLVRDCSSDMVSILRLLPSGRVTWIQPSRLQHLVTPNVFLAAIKTSCLDLVKNSDSVILVPFNAFLIYHTLSRTVKSANLTIIGLALSTVALPILWQERIPVGAKLGMSNLADIMPTILPVVSSLLSSGTPWKRRMLRRVRISKRSCSLVSAPIYILNTSSALQTNDLKFWNSALRPATVVGCFRFAWLSSAWNSSILVLNISNMASMLCCTSERSILRS